MVALFALVLVFVGLAVYVRAARFLQKFFNPSDAYVWGNRRPSFMWERSIYRNVFRVYCGGGQVAAFGFCYDTGGYGRPVDLMIVRGLVEDCTNGVKGCSSWHIPLGIKWRERTKVPFGDKLYSLQNYLIYNVLFPRKK